MDEEIKSSLDALESRVSATEKRFDDVKWYIGGASVIFSALTLVLGWNFSGERNALRDAVKDMKEEVRDTLTRLGQAAVPPQLVLLGPDANPLADQRLKGDVQRKDDGTTMLSLFFAVENTGSGVSGPIWMKLYTQKDMPTFLHSVDNPLYPYVVVNEPEYMHPSSIPGKYTAPVTWSFPMPPPGHGRHRVLIKAYYGNGLVSEAAFWLEVK